MAASKLSANRIKNTVAFNFKHKLSKVVFNFKAGDAMEESELAGMTVQLTNQQSKATFDVTQSDGEVVVSPDSPIDITLLTDANGKSAEGIVLPSANFDNMTLHLELADGSSFFNWDLKNSQNADKFEAGKKYVYDITVNRSGLGVTATITDWTPGNGENGEQGEALNDNKEKVSDIRRSRADPGGLQQRRREPERRAGGTAPFQQFGSTDTRRQ